MFLSSKQIEQAVNSGELGISPFNPDNLKPASYTFTLDNILTDPNTGEEIYLDDLDDAHLRTAGYELPPGGFILGKTAEVLNLNNKFVCILSTRGSIAQMGIDALRTSCMCEPDTNSKLTLEITNRNFNPIILKPSMLIVKGLFSRISFSSP